MRIKRKTLIEVGLFVALGLGAGLLSVFFIGRDSTLFGKTFTIVAPFDDVSGLRKGATVQLAGLNVGYVDGVRLPKDKGVKNLEVILRISENYREHIRKDSSAAIHTQGLLGDKFVLITRGSHLEPALKDGEVIRTESRGGIAQLTGKGEEMIREITLAAKKFREALDKLPLETTDKEKMKQIVNNVEGASADLRDIFASINRGEGTIGALVKDPGLYHDMRTLMGRANRSKLLKNLIRSTLADQEKGTEKPLQ